MVAPARAVPTGIMTGTRAAISVRHADAAIATAATRGSRAGT
jgi:hypothetical protein